MPYSLDDPQALTTCLLSDLRATARAVEKWSELEARQLDQALRSRVVDLLAGGEEADLVELYRCMETLIPHVVRPELQAMERDWIARWQSWADLLDARAAQLRSRDPSRVHHLRHVPAILEAVRLRPGLTQAELAEMLSLTPPNLSRLMRILEDHALVERRVEGQSKRVYARQHDR